MKDEITSKQRELSMVYDVLRHTSHSREPRQIFAGAALVGTLWNSFTSIFDHEEISTLKEDISKEHESQRFITTQITTLQQTMNLTNSVLTRAVKHLKYLEKDALTRDALNSLRIIRMTLSQLRTEIRIRHDNFISAIKLILQNKISTHLVHLDEASTSLNAIKTLAERRGLTPVFPELVSLYESDITTLVIDNMLEIFVHIPLFRAPTYQLYKFVPVPIDVPSLNGTVIPNPKEAFIAISPTNDIFVSFDASMLQSCAKKGQITYCDKLLSYRKDVQEDCLASLFHNHVTGIVESCPFRRASNSADRIIPTNGDHLLLYSPVQTAFQISCGRFNDTQILVGPGYKQITLHEACTISSEHSFFIKEADIRSQVPLRSSFVLWHGDNLLGADGIVPTVDRSELDSISQLVQDSQTNQIRLNKSLNAIVSRVHSTAPTHWSHFTTMTNTTLLILIVPIIAIISGLILRYKFCKKSKKKTTELTNTEKPN